MKNKKIIASIFLALSLSSPFMPVSAKMPDTEIVTPCWEYIDNIDIDYAFLDSNVNLMDRKRNQNTTKLEGTLTLYKKVGSNWVYVADNSGSSTRSLSIDVEFEPESGVTYKAVAEVTASPYFMR